MAEVGIKEREVAVKQIPGNRKNPLLSCEGYLHERNRVLSSGGVSYRCLKYKSCPARIHMLPQLTVLKAEHNHGPDFEKVTSRKIVDTAKNIMKENRFSAMKDAMFAIESMVEEEGISAAALGSTQNLKRRLNDTRMKEQESQNLGETLEELNIPDKLRTTTSQQRFLIYDNKAGEFSYINSSLLPQFSKCKEEVLLVGGNISEGKPSRGNITWRDYHGGINRRRDKLRGNSSDHVFMYDHWSKNADFLKTTFAPVSERVSFGQWNANLRQPSFYHPPW